ncbi:MAG: T9SS type A sorting domain-containing protein [Spirosomataceae bacterium]
MKKIYTILILCLLSKISQGQIISGNAFLKGQYIEVGLAPKGYFGTTVNAPAGYHTRGGGALGFIADPAKDGWNVGSPDFCGDYFLPGTPEEGWSIQFNGNVYSNNGALPVDIDGSIINYSDDGTKLVAIWQGVKNGLEITSKTYFPKGALYFVTEVTVRNVSPSTVSNIYYMRNVDPDQEATMGGTYSTNNSIAYQTPNSSNTALVTATGTIYGCYLGLGARDCRARVTHGGFSNRNPVDVWNGVGLNNSGTLENVDQAISISFKIGDLGAGQSTKIAYAYVLSASQLDEALGSTVTGFQSANGSSINSGTSISSCLNTSFPLKIENGDAYNWNWSPSIGLNTTTGNSVIATLTNSTPITYTATGNGICGTLTVQITLAATIPELSLTTSATPPAICSGSTSSTISASLSGGTMPYTYSWSDGLGIGDSKTVSPGGTKTYTVTATDKNGCAKSGEVSVLVGVLPLPSISPNTPQSICSGATLSLSGSSTGGTSPSYAWSAGSGAFTSNQQNPSFTAPTVGSSTNYTVTLTTSEGACSATATLPVTVHPLPTISVMPPAAVCAPNTVNLAAAVSSNGTVGYFTNSGFSSLVANPTAIVTSGTYYLKATTSNSCSVSTTASVTVNSPSAVSISISKSPVCAGETIQLSATSGLSAYQWAASGGTFASTVQQATFRHTADGGYTISLTVTNSLGCTSSTSVSVSVSVPVVSIDLYAAVCAGKPLALSTTSGLSNYKWIASSGSFSSTLHQATFSSNVAGIYRFSVTITNTVGCTTSATASTSVKALPLVTLSASATEICIGKPLTLSAPTGASSYSWTASGGVFSSTVNQATFSSSQTGAYQIGLTASANGCTATSTMSLSVKPLPVVTARSNGPICLAQPINLTASGASTYTWSGPNSFSATGSTTSRPIATAVMDGVYQVTGTGSNGCSASTTLSVQVAQGAIASTNAPVCMGTTLSLSVNAADSYSWRGPTGSGFSSTIQNPQVPNVSIQQAGVYLVTTRVFGSCWQTGMVMVALYQTPDASFKVTTSDGKAICTGSTVKLSANATGGYFNWIGPNGSSLGTANMLTINNFNANKAGNYTLRVSNLSCTFETKQALQLQCTSAARLSSEEEPTVLQVKTYPNPTRNNLTVEVNQEEAMPVRIIIRDEVGREKAVWKKEESLKQHRFEINMSMLTEGMWFLQIQNEKNSVVKKIWKVD